MGCTDDFKDTFFDWADFLVVGLSFGVVVGFGLFQGYKGNKASNHGYRYAEFYFLANRSISWIFVGAALFSTDIGAGHLTGLFGAGGSQGLVVAAHQWWGGSLILIPMAYLFIPVYINSNMKTTPEYIGHRYNPLCRMYVAILTILLYILQQIPAQLYAGSIFLNEVIGFHDLYASGFIFIGLTGLYCIVGGLKAVIYTEVVQCIFILTAGAIAMVYAFGEKGYFEVKSELGDYFVLFKNVTRDEEFPGVGVIFLPLTMAFYWVGDQASPYKLVLGGRIASGIMMVISIAFLPILDISTELYLQLQQFFSYFIPPLSALFILGVLWPRANEFGAMLGLSVTFFIGLVRAILNVYYSYSPAPEGFWFLEVNYIFFGCMLFGTAMCLMIIGSLMTPPPDAQKTAGYTFWEKVPDLFDSDFSLAAAVIEDTDDEQLRKHTMHMVDIVKNVRENLTHFCAAFVVAAMIAMWIIYD